ncbi:hypothetical protein ABH920_010013 [Catenulispora sp. EB89]|uniref:hypothetical protein n=1 Tax=Catenulispora sp. EB89 TaxID=3156257 RepID=UPI00351282C3
MPDGLVLIPEPVPVLIPELVPVPVPVPVLVLRVAALIPVAAARAGSIAVAQP